MARQALLALMLLGTACSHPVYQVMDEPLRLDPSLTLEEVQKVIENAAVMLGWNVKEMSPGHLRATKTKGAGKHGAAVSIEFDRTGFSIYYLDSHNLDYDGESIHELYNVWVMQLEEAIRQPNLQETRPDLF